MLAEFSVVPADREHMSEDIAAAIGELSQSGLPYRVGPLSTSVEGELEEILRVVARCHRAVADRGSQRVITTIQPDEHCGAPQSLEEAALRVEQHLS